METTRGGNLRKGVVGTPLDAYAAGLLRHRRHPVHGAMRLTYHSADEPGLIDLVSNR
jgi:hypothetical protein